VSFVGLLLQKPPSFVYLSKTPAFFGLAPSLVFYKSSL
jgi:hypothetical protein